MPQFDARDLSQETQEAMIDFCKSLLINNYGDLQNLANAQGIEMDIDRLFPLIQFTMACMVADKDNVDGCIMQMNKAQLVIFNEDPSTPAEEDEYLQLRTLISRTIGIKAGGTTMQ